MCLAGCDAVQSQLAAFGRLRRPWIAFGRVAELLAGTAVSRASTTASSWTGWRYAPRLVPAFSDAELLPRFIRLVGGAGRAGAKCRVPRRAGHAARTSRSTAFIKPGNLVSSSVVRSEL